MRILLHRFVFVTLLVVAGTAVLTGQTGVEELRARAEQGDAEAQYEVGLMYKLGQSGPQDDAEAVKWYRMAAEQGYAEAQAALGQSYFYGEGVPEDSAEGVKWSRMAAEQGGAVYQHFLGIIYSLYLHLQDDAEAAKWYRLAAEHPDPSGESVRNHPVTVSRLVLGRMYSEGQGVPQDYAEAAKWYRMAARQGVAEAQYKLGLMYDIGQGVSQDHAEAAKWYRMATEAELSRLTSEQRSRIEDDACLVESSAAASRSTAQAAYHRCVQEQLAALRAPSRGGFWRTLREIGIGESPWWQGLPGAPPGAVSGSLEPAAIFKKVSSSVYVVLASPLFERFPSETTVSQGSAVAVSSQHLITNCHVLRFPGSVLIRQRGNVAKAKFLHTDRNSDRCILEVTGQTLSPVPGVRPYRTLTVGERVYTVGTPKGFEQSLGEGLISGLREAEGTRQIQTTAPISPGSSGGGLFDSSGNLLGITTSFSDGGQVLNFAIPAEDYWDQEPQKEQ